MTAFYGGVTGSLPVRIGSPGMRLRLLCVSSLISRVVHALGNGRRRYRFRKLSMRPGTSNECYCYPIARGMALNRVISLLRRFTRVPRALVVPRVSTGSFTGHLCDAFLDCLPRRGTVFSLGVGISRHNDFARLMRALGYNRMDIGVSGPNIAGNRR